jgi:hypothetical protein
VIPSRRLRAVVKAEAMSREVEVEVEVGRVSGGAVGARNGGIDTLYE